MNTKALYNVDQIVSFRRDIHKHAELAYKEERTRNKILEFLTSLGIKENQIRHVIQTGLIVDIAGTGEPSGKPFCVALRADMDGLPIKEENPEIDYQSVTGAAHMCGHDMHVACLLGGTALILEKLDQIPSDKKVRLLFQPAEEDIGGAAPMIKEGALEGVDEVYGMHNWPLAKPGKLFIKKGYMMASLTNIEIEIHGKGGHSSLKDHLNDPLQPVIDIQIALRSLVKEYKDKGEKFTVCLPYVKTGDAPNAIADTCEVKGLLRSFGDEFAQEFSARLRKTVEDICKDRGCTADIKIYLDYPPLFNTDDETENVIRVGRKVYGEENVIDNDPRLPIYGGEDFAYFNKEKPGAFFFLTSSKKDTDVLHSNKFDPEDEMIPKACELWLRLIEDRFGLNFQ